MFAGHRRTAGPLAAAALVALALAGCAAGSRSASGQAWAATAEEWFAHFHDAEHQGFTNLAAFYTADAAVDFRALDGMDGAWHGLPPGRTATVQHYRDLWGRQSTRESTQPLYLSRDGAVDVVRFDTWSDAAFLYSMTPAGARAETFTGSALWTAQRAAASGKTPAVQAAGVLAARALVDRYVQAWSSGDPASVQPLYAPDAAVTDSLHGLTATGASSIGGLAPLSPAAGGLRGATLQELPDQGGRAYFLAGDLAEDPTGAFADELVLLLTMGTTNRCPGDVAVVLHLADGTITAEQRYHRIDAVRRCTTRNALPGGWWDHIQVPDAVTVVRTDGVEGPNHPVDLWNGTSGLRRMVEWALSRYETSGLDQPPTRSVTFLPDSKDCEGIYGFAHGAGFTDAAVCSGEQDACGNNSCTQWTKYAKAATLHELAHSWLDRFTDAATRTQFLTRTRTTGWLAPNQPWASQGAERAAETLTWGLMDQPYSINPAFGDPTCVQLAADFQLLTRTAPLGQSCTTPSTSP